MLYICSDHGGFRLKSQILKHLVLKNILFEDQGPLELNPSDDYPVYVDKTISKFLENPKENKAIVICRNGVGVSMMANKYIGTRAGVSWTPDHAKSSRKDDDTNVLALPADYIDEKTAIEIVDTWLNTPFSKEPRYEKRLEMVEERTGK